MQTICHSFFDLLKKKCNSGILWPKQLMAGGFGLGQNLPLRSSFTEWEMGWIVSKLVFRRGPQYSTQCTFKTWSKKLLYTVQPGPSTTLSYSAYFSTKYLDVWDREHYLSYSPRRQDFCTAVFVLMNISSKNRNRGETSVSNEPMV